MRRRQVKPSALGCGRVTEMTSCFFDTCALIPRYRTGKFTYRVNRLFAGRRSIHIAEISVVEVASALASIVRDNHLPDSEFRRMHAAFLTDLADGRIEVRPLSRQDMVKATHLIELGGLTNRAGLKSADALVAVSGRELALERGERISFYTKDWKLYRTLFEINAYRAAMRLNFLGPGRPGVPASTK